MAGGRLSSRTGASQAIWPGFVDAMTALLLVLMFVLSIFMIVQFVLRTTITGQENELDALGQELAQLSNVLAMEQARGDDLETDLTVARANLNDRDRNITRLTALSATLSDQRDALNARVASFEDQVAGLLSQQANLQQNIATLTANRDQLQADLSASEDQTAQLIADKDALEAANAREITEKEAVQLALANLRDELDAEVEAARLAAAQREAMETLIASLQSEKSGLEAQTAEGFATITVLEADKAALEAAMAKLEAARAELESDKAALEDETASRRATISALEAEKAERLALVALLEYERDLGAENLAKLEANLSETEKARLLEVAAAEALRQRLAEADTELTAMTLALEEKRREAEETLTLLAAAETARADLDTDLSAQAATLSRERALKAVAEQALAARTADLDASAEEIKRRAREMALLNSQAAELRSQLAALSAQLDASEAKDKDQNIQIANLGSRLNAALARELQLKASEAILLRREAEKLEAETNDLEAYRSEFFGEMRKALGEREEIRIVGDRFIFQSEVLFDAGSADLGAAGRQELARLSTALRSAIARIPDGIDWLLVVEGHTDNTPLAGTGRYRNNWELSQGRALSVVRFLSEAQGLPPERLAALGYGEYQPVASGDDDTSLSRNRRIELKFAERPTISRSE